MERILPEDELYRRVAPDQIAHGEVTSAAYKVRGKPDNHISVDLARLTDPATSLRRAQKPRFRLGQLATQVPLALEFEVNHRPEPENYAHSQIEGHNSRQKCRELAKATQLLEVTIPDQAEAVRDEAL